MANISIKDKEVQKNLKANVGRVISIKGTLKAGDPINPLTGDALDKDIAFQKNTQHRKYLIKDEHFKFSVNNAEIITHADGKKTAAEAYLAQQIYGDDNTYTVETKSNREFALGYKKEDGTPKLINRASVAGKHFAHGQLVTINYKVYEMRDTGDCNVGFENLVFEEQPKFWQGQVAGAIGAFADWDTEADDLGDAEVIMSEAEASQNAENEESDENLWENDWE